MENIVDRKPCKQRKEYLIYHNLIIHMLLWTWGSYQLQHHRLFVMVDPLGRRSGRKSSQVRKILQYVSSKLRTGRIVVVAMLEKTERSRVVTSMSPCTSHWSLAVWTRRESHIQSQNIIWEDQERGWLPLWVSSTKQGQRNTTFRVCHRKYQYEEPIKDYQGVWEIA